jgi:hypothetical protein
VPHDRYSCHVCEEVDESVRLMKGGEFCDWLNNYQQIKSLVGNEAFGISCDILGMK